MKSSKLINYLADMCWSCLYIGIYVYNVYKVPSKSHKISWNASCAKDYFSLLKLLVAYKIEGQVVRRFLSSIHFFVSREVVTLEPSYNDSLFVWLPLL
jgi:hypothetical protein